MVADKKPGTVICTSFTFGKCHDFRLFKDSNLPINQKIKILADTGFQGIKKFHENSEIPKKRFKNQKLTLSDKLENRRISRQRVNIENIGFIKRFKIISEKYRNRRKHFLLRFNLIFSICNFDLMF
ncbi:MAG: transposase [Clostridia bacterium]|nr:transposase [Clostridia bacterium]